MKKLNKIVFLLVTIFTIVGVNAKPYVHSIKPQIARNIIKRAPSTSSPSAETNSPYSSTSLPDDDASSGATTFNAKYPLTSPIYTYRIGIISDLDRSSRINDTFTWKSYFKKGYLIYDKNIQAVDFKMDNGDGDEITSKLSEDGRGMELSELITYNGKLLTFDDRTGVVFYLIDNKVIPWVILPTGNGQKSKGFKTEWAAVKDKILYVGSFGTHLEINGVIDDDLSYVKTVTADGKVDHKNWIHNYNAMKNISEYFTPGYLSHESGVWSDKNKRWYFLPRKCSKEEYEEIADERKGCNLLLIANEHFTDIKKIELQTFPNTMGYSSFKFIPDSDEKVIVALQSEEYDGKAETSIIAFTVDGVVLKSEKFSKKYKYEGIEFI